MAPIATVNEGQRLHYVDHGGDGPPVVLLHAFLMDHEMFAPQVRDLGQSFRLVAVDERGHGGTTAEGPFDYWDVARDVLGLLDLLGIERAAVVGTSQGGFIGMRMALLARERVPALAVMGTSAAAQDPQIADAYRQLGQAWATAGPGPQVIDTIADICLGDMPAQDWKDKWRQVPASVVVRNIDTLVDRDDLLARLGELSCPTLVLHGSTDGAYPVSHAEDIVRAVPGARPLVLVEGGAHFLSLTHAAAVNPALREFLTENA